MEKRDLACIAFMLIPVLLGIPYLLYLAVTNSEIIMFIQQTPILYLNMIIISIGIVLVVLVCYYRSMNSWEKKNFSNNIIAMGLSLLLAGGFIGCILFAEWIGIIWVIALTVIILVGMITQR